VIRFLARRLLAYEYALGYRAGFGAGLEEAERRRAAALEKVWAVIDEPTIPGRPYTHSAVGPIDHFDDNVVSIHQQRADGKWHL